MEGAGSARASAPFTTRLEGSFTVYGDSERFYCFGCGEGGDVLDFIQQAEGLSLPEAIARLDGSPGLAPRAAIRPAGTRRPKSSALAPRDPALLTAAARFYAGRLRRCLRSAGVPGLAGRRPGRRSPPQSRLLRRAAGCGRPWSPAASQPPSACGTPGCSPSGERSGSPGWSSYPTPPAASSTGSPAGPSIPTGLPASRRSPAPSRCLGLGRLGPAPAMGGCRGGPVRLARPCRMGPSGCRSPGHPGHGAGRLSPPGLSPRLPRLRRRRRGT